MFCFEIAVKLIHYEPPFGALFTSTTPREFVMWGHRFFPIFVFTALFVKKALFVDMENHRKLQLQYMLKQNEVRLLLFCISNLVQLFVANMLFCFDVSNIFQ